MRISDWSSDVCSSDLRHRRTVCGRHRHACVVKLDVDEARRGAALILPEEKGDAASVTGARADREVPVGDIDRQGRHIVEARKADRFGVPRGHDGMLSRSEVHTSELQSLMRNSYAVFCLKKKTN